MEESGGPQMVVHEIVWSQSPRWGPERKLVIHNHQVGQGLRGGQEVGSGKMAAVGQRMTLQFLNLKGVLMVFLV